MNNYGVLLGTLSVVCIALMLNKNKPIREPFKKEFRKAMNAISSLERKIKSFDDQIITALQKISKVEEQANSITRTVNKIPSMVDKKINTIANAMTEILEPLISAFQRIPSYGKGIIKLFKEIGNGLTGLLQTVFLIVLCPHLLFVELLNNGLWLIWKQLAFPHQLLIIVCGIISGVLPFLIAIRISFFVYDLLESIMFKGFSDKRKAYMNKCTVKNVKDTWENAIKKFPSGTQFLKAIDPSQIFKG